MIPETETYREGIFMDMTMLLSILTPKEVTL